MIIDGLRLTAAQALRFHADLESREGEYFPSASEINRYHVDAGDVTREPQRSVSRDAVSGYSPMECETMP